MPDGTPLEDHGVQPNVPVGSGDALEVALADLRRKLVHPKFSA
jgi:hypothetical protein